MAVVSFSPLQWIFWYDKAAAYQGEPEVEFFQHVPTVWDETKVLAGEIGRYAVIARRKGDEWFIGAINGSEARELKVPLDFLGGSRKYQAHIYSDDALIATRPHVRVETRAVDAGATLNLQLGATGGAAIWIGAEAQ